MICCVTGHRPSGFSFSREDDSRLFFHYREILSRKIDDLIIGGCEHFITGMADGAWNTLKYAVSKGKMIKYIKLADIKINIDTSYIV